MQTPFASITWSRFKGSSADQSGTLSQFVRVQRETGQLPYGSENAPEEMGCQGRRFRRKPGKWALRHPPVLRNAHIDETQRAS